MKILVTGSSGQLGGALCHSLVQRGDHVVGVSRSLGKCKNLLSLSLFKHIAVDLENPQPKLKQIIDNGPYDAAVFLSASISRESDSNRNHHGFNVDVKGHAQVLEALGHSVNQVTYASSITVYGVPSRLPVCENHQVAPRSDYAATKLAAEYILGSICHTRHINWAALRIAQVYGHGSPRHLVLYRFLDQAFSQQIPVISVAPETKRHYLHLEDFTSCILAILGAPLSGVFNLAGPEPVSLYNLASWAMELAGLKGTPTVLANAPAYSLEFAINALENATGFQPRISIKTGLQMEAKRLYGRTTGRIT